MRILYRISDGGYNKIKLDFADKFYCLENCIKVFGSSNLIVFADNCKPETLEKLRKYPIVLKETQIGSSGQSWKMVANYALQNYDNPDVVYFLEDDYLHRAHSETVILEGLTIGDYVTLYDHLDKYMEKSIGGNPMVKNGGELTRVLLTKSTHWKITNSTTMTFACKVKTLREDWVIFDEFTKESHPHDDQIFYKLQGIKKLKYKIFGKRRKLVVPIPGYSTHIEPSVLSPLIDWHDV